MIITKEHQQAMVNNYRKEGHNEFECMGFVDGMNKMFDLIKSKETTRIKKTDKTNFKELISVLHKSLIDADLDDNQFNSIWNSINEVYRKIKIYE